MKGEANMDKEFINNQSSLDSTKGSYGKFGSLAGNACGAIAMTNICRMDNKDIELDEVVQKNLAKAGNIILGGALGTNPFAVKKVLKEYGFQVKYLGAWRNTAQVQPYKYFIVLYSWAVRGALGLHYQAGRVLKNGQLELFNPYHIYENVDDFKQGEDAACAVIYGIN